MPATPLESMRKTASTYAAARDALAALVQAMKDEVATIERGAMPDIQRAARRIAGLHAELQGAIESHPECFERPRTYVVDGLKFGMQKQRGKLRWENDDEVIRLARRAVASGKLTPEQLAVLVRTKEEVNADALAQLPAAVVKALGVTVTEDRDAPFIKTVDVSVEKVIGALIKQATQQAVEAAGAAA